jgi:5-methylcytosine-specific restriction endonuclease McrA
MRLRSGERCPIHHRYYCCNRKRPDKARRERKQAVTVLEDGRVICSRAELRRRLVRCLEKQKGICGICQNLISDVQEAVLDHIEPRGMGAGSRNDDWSNIRATHVICNNQKGSIRNYSPPDRKAEAAGDRQE